MKKELPNWQHSLLSNKAIWLIKKRHRLRCFFFIGNPYYLIQSIYYNNFVGNKTYVTFANAVSKYTYGHH